MNKLSILQLSGRLLCFIIISLFAVNLYAAPQRNVKIKLKLDDVALEKVISEIEAQSPYLFNSSDNIDFSTKVSISVSQESIENVCKKLFTPLKISWRIVGDYIYLEKLLEPETREFDT